VDPRRLGHRLARLIFLRHVILSVIMTSARARISSSILSFAAAQPLRRNGTPRRRKLIATT